MDQASRLLATTNHVYTRADLGGDPSSRPAFYKTVGICLAIASGLFIGVSFILKKMGLLAANAKYNEEAGEGYGFLKNAYWWGGMTLMILGELCNLAAYAFTDAILVTPLGALSVVVTTVLSAIFLKERLSMVGKVSCFLCLVGSVVIVMNAPQQSAVATIEQMQDFVIKPGFLSYAGVIIIGFFVAAFWAGPKWGKKTMLVYISICSWIGGLSVVATQGLGAAILTQIEGTPQFNKWFIYVLLVFVIGTLLIEIVYLNKALNIYNAAMVTPTYYVYFTSTTIITSAVLFRGFKGSANQIVSVVMGFLTICAGVVLLQLSKSAKDVPDTAVFTGNLDQIHTIAEQEQSETEPKADAIRGAAAIVRRFSATRQKREAEEFKRLHEEKQREQLAPVGEDGPEYEWDGLRRRKTMLGSQSSVGRGRSGTVRSTFTIPRTPEVHPPLGMSHFPTDDELADIDRPSSPGMMSSIAGTIRNRARSVLTPNRPDFSLDPKQQPPMPPVPLTDIAVSGHSINDGSSYRTRPHDSDYGVSNTEYTGAKGVYHARHGSHVSGVSGGSSFLAPTPPPHTARRQFSFQNIFKRGQTSSSAVEADDELPHPPRSAGHLTRFGLGSRGNSTPQVKNATEEEQAGLVKGDSRSMPALPRYDDDDDDDYDDDENDEYYPGDDKRHVLGHSGDLSSAQASKYGRGITGSPPSRAREDQVAQEAEYEAQRTRYNTSRGGSERSPSPPQPPPHRTPPHRKGGSRDAFM
ncbi:hypothetical protein VD0002_g5082 [Verticillium dahliae]|uniref:DUF803 domain membrane protein n=2 Tax=Verticillium dahliae TaxID=27337 RepID=G2XID5_VERDV|nr:uncharacterized protein VDAG_09917 [Verticillium dahliae VdLs.17]KAF3347263.1 hypothetical protein VdG2_04542 [Verticillium dahliae VDG2]KAH6701898.1 magnesium transporter NIPA-domain-containing protein [Verticillium dahliae]EGY19583.1 hypothetical protein VDAG_09917 [Verticillium dahliae VdLs.17]PNH29732.1 hypothetical protein BJF96_g6889 [Verticillium dahliae]PNH63229.1 hypothetical protein VD0002_g5082 [Verticillium dahliae]